MANGTCRECAREDRPIMARGLCGGCYMRRHQSGDWGPYDKVPQLGGRPRIDPNRTEKRCSRCREVLPIEAFSKGGSASDGRTSYCKACARKAGQERAERNRKIEPTTDGTQVCRVCDTEKPLTGFYWKVDRAARDRRCIACVRDYSREAWVARRGKAQRSKILADKYGLTEQQYWDMHAAQKGRCAICDAEPSETRALAVDHDHATGAVRALLCGRCNPALGLFQDDPRLLRLAALYLETHSGEAGA